VIQLAVVPLRLETKARRTVGVLNVPRILGLSMLMTTLAVLVSLGCWRTNPRPTLRKKMHAGLLPVANTRRSVATNVTLILAFRRQARRDVDAHIVTKTPWEFSLMGTAARLGLTL
jgi:hypothetical protein